MKVIETLAVATVMLASVMCSHNDAQTSDAGDAGDGGEFCEPNAAAACGTPGGDYAMTTASGCTGTLCGAGEICVSSAGNLTCVSLAAVCGGSAGVIQTIVACHTGGVCPTNMICGSLNTCVPNCAGDGG